MQLLRRIATALLTLVLLVGVGGCLTAMSGVGVSLAATQEVSTHHAGHHAAGEHVQVAADEQAMPVDCVACWTTHDALGVSALFLYDSIPLQILASVFAVTLFAAATLVDQPRSRAPPWLRLRPDLGLQLRAHRTVVLLR